MVCIRNNLKVHTQALKFGSNDKFRESIKLQIHDPGPVFRSRFKTFKEETEFEDDKFAITLEKEELLNHDSCTWLSTGDASSPSSCSQDNGLSSLFDCMDLKIDAWFISLLSTKSQRCDTILNSKVTFFDGSRVNPIEEASLILDQRKLLDEDVGLQEKLLEEEVVSWLQNDSSDNHPDWSYGQTLDKKSKSKLVSYDYDCATPVDYSFSSISDSSDEYSLFSSSSSSDYSSEIMDLEEISTDQPLFWPFNLESDWCSEYKWDSFIMSPRKKAGNSPKWDLLIMSPEIQSDTHGTIGCSSTDVAQSRSIEANDNEQPKGDRLSGKNVRKHKVVLEDLLLVERLNVNIEGGVIEQVLGLGEFDGHEGIQTTFNKDQFSLF